MAFLVYFLVLLITAGGVLFGFDWLSAPMSPMPPIKPVAMQVAKSSVPPQQPDIAKTPVRTVVVATPAPAPAPAAPLRDVVTTVAPEPASPAAQPDTVTASPATTPLQETPAVAAGESAPPAADAVAAQEPAPKCDVDACTAAYRSFTASDCTYQPLVGPRRLCSKGNVPGEDTANAAANARADAGARCNVTACAAAYTTFSAADCTYQPYDGPRRLCEK